MVLVGVVVHRPAGVIVKYNTIMVAHLVVLHNFTMMMVMIGLVSVLLLPPLY